MAGISRRRVVAAGALAAIGAAPGVGRLVRPARGQDARFFRIATGPSESSYFAVGTLIGGVVSSPPGARECDRGGSCGVPGLIALTQSTAGSLANVDLVGSRRIESGICQADVAYCAYHGTGLYRRQGAVRNLRAIANLFPEHLHIVTRREAGIREMRHLRGKTVALGERESGTLVTARAILQSQGIAERDLRARFLNPVQAADALREGKLDAFFELAALPSRLVVDLAQGVEIDLLAIGPQAAARLRSAYPFFKETVIPAGAYRGLGETPTLSIGARWIVGAEVEEQVVYGLTRALWHPNNRRALDQGHAIGRLIRRETALEEVALPLHPGAALYYFEAGVSR